HLRHRRKPPARTLAPDSSPRRILVRRRSSCPGLSSADLGIFSNPASSPQKPPTIPASRLGTSTTWKVWLHIRALHRPYGVSSLATPWISLMRRDIQAFHIGRS